MSVDKNRLKTESACFAAGCFWGVQYYFDQVPGVVSTKVGYSGGHTTDPTYEEVCSHQTGHAEAVLLGYSPDKISYSKLLKHYFRMHDPTQLNRQGPDIGDNYRSAIFYFNTKQKLEALKAKADAQSSFKNPIVTEIVPFDRFYEAEDYHQKFTERTGRGACHVEYAEVA